MAEREELSGLLAEVGNGNREAFDAVLPIVYEELRVLAHRQLAGQPRGQTLSTTALVHEAYLKLLHQPPDHGNDRRHFFSVAALAMRQIVVDYARRRRAKKRGAGVAPVRLDDWDGTVRLVEDQAATLVALDDALHKLAAVDGRLVKVVELRFFGGLSVEETAAVLGLSPVTVKRDTRAARAFIARELRV